LDQVTTTSAYYGSTTTTIGIEHNLSITSTRLVAGTATESPIQLKVVYGKYKNQ
jgi:hypothetical protein